MAYSHGGPGRLRPHVAGGAVASLILGVVAMLGICGMFVPVYLKPDLPAMAFAAAMLFAGFGGAAVFAAVGARRQIAVGAATGNGLAVTGMVLGVIAIVNRYN